MSIKFKTFYIRFLRAKFTNFNGRHFLKFTEISREIKELMWVEKDLLMRKQIIAIFN